MSPEPPYVPEGYVLIKQGKVRSTDLTWNDYEHQWTHPSPRDFEALGSDVSCYFGVARKNPNETDTQEPRSIAVCVEELHKGNPISDQEVVDLIHAYTRVIEASRPMGILYRGQALDASQTRSRLNLMALKRGLKL